MIDAGVFSGAYNTRDKYHEQAVKLLEDALTVELLLGLAVVQ